MHYCKIPSIVVKKDSTSDILISIFLPQLTYCADYSSMIHWITFLPGIQMRNLVKF